MCDATQINESEENVSQDIQIEGDVDEYIDTRINNDVVLKGNIQNQVEDQIQEKESDKTATNLDHNKNKTTNLHEKETIDQNNEISNGNIVNTSVTVSQNIQESPEILQIQKETNTVEKPVQDSEMVTKDPQLNLNDVNLKNLNMKMHLKEVYKELTNSNVNTQDSVQETENEAYILEDKESEDGETHEHFGRIIAVESQGLDGEPTHEHFGRIIAIESQGLLQDQLFDSLIIQNGNQDLQKQMPLIDDKRNTFYFNLSQNLPENDNIVDEYEGMRQTEQSPKENYIDFDQYSILHDSNGDIQDENKSEDGINDAEFTENLLQTQNNPLQEKNNESKEKDRSLLVKNNQNLSEKKNTEEIYSGCVDMDESQNLLVERQALKSSDVLDNEDPIETPLPKRQKGYVWQNNDHQYSLRHKEKVPVKRAKRIRLRKVKIKHTATGINDTAAEKILSGDVTICPECKLVFSKKGIASHLKKHAIVNYKCCLCLETFVTNEELKKHKKTHDETISEYYCEFCNEVSLTFLNFRQHVLGHVKLPHICEECGLKCTLRCNLIIHTLNHFESKLKCPKCNKVIKNKKCLRSHLRTHNMKTCVECGDAVLADSFQHHMLLHAGVQLIQCIYCGDGFYNVKARRKHQNTCRESCIS